MPNEKKEWYEDHPVDISIREDSIADGPGLCYHCDNSIPVGSKATTFGPIRLHTACVEDYLDSAVYEKAMAEHRKNPVTYTHDEVKKML